MAKFIKEKSNTKEIKNKNLFKSNSGITMVALVIVIIVMLMLAGISINAVVGRNGVITQAQKASLSADFTQYKEEFDKYKIGRKNSSINNEDEFLDSSLNANYQANSLEYNTKPADETGNILTIIPDLKSEYYDGNNDNGEISVVNGKLVFKSQDQMPLDVAVNLGYETNP